MTRPLAIYLDIETTQSREIAIVGFHSYQTGTIQLVGTEATAGRLRKWLPTEGRLYTFNGEAFDLRVIHEQLGVDLHRRFESRDLLHDCRRIGWSGGQKHIEKRARFRRSRPPLSCWEIWGLWRRHDDWNDHEALKRLIAYNKDDLDGLRAIHRHLARRN